MRTLRPTRSRLTAAAGTAAWLLAAPAALTGQVPGADSTKALEEVRELQRAFESFRESHTPIQRGARPEGACDERIGRICIWFGGEDEETFPAELPDVALARTKLIGALEDAFERTPHRWVIGQLVYYLVESRNVDEAERVASRCGIPETWWCSALLGYVHHMRREYIEAEAAFREALASMPVPLRDEWMTRYVLTGDVLEELEEASPTERDR
ncbi:MAG TPA: hypothetical protein VE646_01445, partial [Actinomycetota bacterium]|nr:hypothetical protein [Actinomycetota bacterium]